MTHQQFQIILKKVRSNKEIRFRVDNKRVDEVVAIWENVAIKIEQYKDRVTVRLDSRTNRESESQTIHFPKGVKKLFNISYWRWRSFCKEIVTQYNIELEKERQEQLKRRMSNFDRILVDSFPEILEDEIFGDD